jgi:alkanesulfonate monooxygenase SsuD/methylene tetrahydromethanopterin reductase-like flavin-dependent oxidoreductase (luciferase family)
VWEVEHHFLEEYSHSSAPEVFLRRASQRTRTIRLGHGIVAAAARSTTTAAYAERIAHARLVSDGGRVRHRRVVVVGRSSSASASSARPSASSGPRRSTRSRACSSSAVRRLGRQAHSVDADPQRRAEGRCRSQHPPLWVACSRRETDPLAAEKGIGALSFSFIEPAEAKEFVDDYYATIQSDACVRPASR